MRLDPNDKVAGYPARQARDYIGKHRYERADNDDPLALALASEGYLEPHYLGDNRQYGWRATLKGGSLGSANFTKPISRATADRIVRETIARAEAVNADQERYLYVVTRLRVFGSYLDPAVDPLGDVDMAIEVADGQRLAAARADDSHTAFAHLCQEHSFAFGPKSLDFYGTLTWPRHQAMQAVRGRSTALSLTDEDPTQYTDRVQTIYEQS